MPWKEFLHSNTDEWEEYLGSLTEARTRALMQEHDATSWESVLEARGRVKAIDDLIAHATVDVREEEARARYRRDTNRK